MTRPGDPVHTTAAWTPDGWHLAVRAAFHGRPADALTVLAGPDPAGPTEPADPARRWLVGVCLGALGHYRCAAAVLLPAGTAVDSLCASTRASHLRQLGRHTEAEPLDLAARALAATSPCPATARADALIGLAADAIGRTDTAAAAHRLAAAGAHVDTLPGRGHWRVRVRLDWVRAEHALLGDRPDLAHAHARAAVRAARAARAPRHRAKSLLVLGVAGHLLDRPEAARVLAAAAGQATRLGVPTVAWPASLVLARALSARDPAASARALAEAQAVLRTLADRLEPADGARFLAAHGLAAG